MTATATATETATWRKINGTWCVRVESLDDMQGQILTVRRADGSASRVEVGGLVCQSPTSRTYLSHAIAPRNHIVATPSGAIIRSSHTQSERCAMQRSGIDSDCDDHDLI